ncbi:imidazolonepropionase [Leucobacter luti]|uniref:imidazolonepropionase n=1 Tax=Leucobacter luti TaxID=340320 RepID=UPI001C68F216|nr:imidazolonepropionase [Leucobacter luti]QYM76321.1 imidazolonepropionase [Leucobacter luti]
MKQNLDPAVKSQPQIAPPGAERATVKINVDLLVIHAAELLTARTPDSLPARATQLDTLELIPDGALAVVDGRIVAVGTTAELSATYTASRVEDASGRLVSPGFVDPHTHLLHGGTRHEDWEGKVLEAPSLGIGGGILSTITGTREASDGALLAGGRAVLDDLLVNGTTTVEVKSGYGLARAEEVRLVRLASELGHPVRIVSSYLGAHMVPDEFRTDRAGYVDEVIATLPEIAADVDSIDIACDPISFTASESRRIAEAARALGLALRFHADQTGDAGGTALAVEFGALSVDHLDEVSDAGLSALAASGSVGVVFPTANAHLLDMTSSLQPGGRPAKDLAAWAQRVRDSGAALALSTDYNPGTSPCSSMQIVLQLAARLYRWSYAQVWQMATINAAAALGLAAEIGSLGVGKRADFVLWDVPSHGAVVHRIGSNLVHQVYRDGELVAERGRVRTRVAAEVGAVS